MGAVRNECYIQKDETNRWKAIRQCIKRNWKKLRKTELLKYGEEQLQTSYSYFAKHKEDKV